MLNPNEQTGKPAKSKSVSRKPVKAKSVKATPAKVVKLERIEDFDFMCFPSEEPFTISLEDFEAFDKKSRNPRGPTPALIAAMKRMRERFPND